MGSFQSSFLSPSCLLSLLLDDGLRDEKLHLLLRTIVSHPRSSDTTSPSPILILSLSLSFSFTNSDVVYTHLQRCAIDAYSGVRLLELQILQAAAQRGLAGPTAASHQ